MLLTWNYYQRITGDTTTDDAVFASAASAAQDLLEDALSRPNLLESAERTETLTVHPGGYMYPNAVPVTVCEGFTVHDDVVYGGTPDLEVWLGLMDSTPATAALTYTGGFDSDTAPGYMLRDLAFATLAILNPYDPAVTAAMIAGATAAHVGDVSISLSSPDVVTTYGGLGRVIMWSRETMRHRLVDP